MTEEKINEIVKVLMVRKSERLYQFIAVLVSNVTSEEKFARITYSRCASRIERPVDGVFGLKHDEQSLFETKDLIVATMLAHPYESPQFLDRLSEPFTEGHGVGYSVATAVLLGVLEGITVLDRSENCETVVNELNAKLPNFVLTMLCYAQLQDAFTKEFASEQSTIVARFVEGPRKRKLLADIASRLVMIPEQNITSQSWSRQFIEEFTRKYFNIHLTSIRERLKFVEMTGK